MACQGAAVGNTGIPFRYGDVPAVSFYISYPGISIAVIEHIATVVSHVALFAPAVPVVGCTAGETFEIPVNAQVFGVGLVHCHHFCLYLHLLFRHVQLSDDTFRRHEFLGCAAYDNRIGRGAEGDFFLFRHLFKGAGCFCRIGIVQAESAGRYSRILLQFSIENDKGGAFHAGRKAAGSQDRSQCFLRRHMIQTGGDRFGKISGKYQVLSCHFCQRADDLPGRRAAYVKAEISFRLGPVDFHSRRVFLFRRLHAPVQFLHHHFMNRITGVLFLCFCRQRRAH